jgi:hypothetical protein
MPTSIIAAAHAREATRRKLTEPQPDKQPRRPRRAAARTFLTLAHRLDPQLERPHINMSR